MVYMLRRSVLFILCLDKERVLRVCSRFISRSVWGSLGSFRCLLFGIFTKISQFCTHYAVFSQFTKSTIYTLAADHRRFRDDH